MMALTPRIAVVSSLTTVPFIYGIRHAALLHDAELLLTTPAQSARHFIDGHADIALIPSVLLPELKLTEQASSFCIAAGEEMRGAVLFSNSPVEEVRRIWVDSESRSAVQLAGYLAAKEWKISPEWLDLRDYGLLDAPRTDDAFLLVGDRVFDHLDEFLYTYDLSDAWRESTETPFVFGLWVTRKGTPYEVTDALEDSLAFGIERIYEALSASDYRDRPDGYDYLTRNVDYLFDSEKSKALQKFWSSGVKVTPRVEPG